MKKPNRLNLTSQVALAALLTALAGCASSNNYEKANNTVAGLQASADSINEGSGKIDASLAALNDLVNNPGDLKTQFAKFSASVDDLQTRAGDVKAKGAAMRAQGADYFSAWDQQLAQIKNEDIKTRSVERRKEMEEKFTAIKTAYVEASDAFKPFMSDLKDIRTALSTDLTTGGVAAIKGVADKTNQDAVPVKARVGKFSDEFKDLGVALASVAPAPTPPPATETK